MFKVIIGEQTPKVAEIENPEQWITDNEDLIQSFFNYSKAKSNAIGLAANQLSKDGDRFMERMFCSRAEGDGDGPWKIFINPKVVKEYGEKQKRTEGCLTWPRKKVLAKRFLKVDVEWWNVEGEKQEETLVGWEAQVWQHEQDHLDGVEEEVVDAKHFTVTSNKVGRNEKCPCDSGKKYKKCCGA
jgi:peptide deformylase